MEDNGNENVEKIRQLEREILSEREDLVFFHKQLRADHQALIHQRGNISKQWHAIKQLEKLMRARLDSESTTHTGLQKRSTSARARGEFDEPKQTTLNDRDKSGSIKQEQTKYNKNKNSLPRLKASTLRQQQNRKNEETRQDDYVVVENFKTQQAQPPLRPTTETSTATSTASVPTSIGQNCELRIDTDFFGGDMEVPFSTGSLAQCCARCNDTPGCQAWSHVDQSGGCWLKARVAPAKHKPGVVSGLSYRARRQQGSHSIADISATPTASRYETRATAEQTDDYIVNTTRACSHIPMLPGNAINTTYPAAMRALQQLVTTGACTK